MVWYVKIVAPWWNETCFMFKYSHPDSRLALFFLYLNPSGCPVGSGCSFHSLFCCANVAPWKYRPHDTHAGHWLGLLCFCSFCLRSSISFIFFSPGVSPPKYRVFLQINYYLSHKLKVLQIQISDWLGNLSESGGLNQAVWLMEFVNMLYNPCWAPSVAIKSLQWTVLGSEAAS